MSAERLLVAALCLLTLASCSKDLASTLSMAVPTDELEVANRVASAVKDGDFHALKKDFYFKLQESDLNKFKPFFAHGELKRSGISKFTRQYVNSDGATREYLDTFNYDFEYANGTTTIVTFQVRKVVDVYMAGPLEVNDKAAYDAFFEKVVVGVAKEYWIGILVILLTIASLIAIAARFIVRRHRPKEASPAKQASSAKQIDFPPPTP